MLELKDTYNEEIKSEEPKTKEELKELYRQRVIDSINHWKEREERKIIEDEARKEMAEEILIEYYPEGIPDGLPNNIRYQLGLEQDEGTFVESDNKVELCEEDIKHIVNRAIELNKRQNQIFETFIDKESYTIACKNNLCGNLVSEYKKIEGLKSNLLDTLQAAYVGHTFGNQFDKHFCEPGNCEDCNRRF